MDMKRCDYCGKLAASNTGEVKDWLVISKGDWARKLDICLDCYRLLEKKSEKQITRSQIY